MGSPEGSINTTLDPTLFWPYGTFKPHLFSNMRLPEAAKFFSNTVRARRVIGEKTSVLSAYAKL
jgi:hypothetical protein